MPANELNFRKKAYVQVGGEGAGIGLLAVMLHAGPPSWQRDAGLASCLTWGIVRIFTVHPGRSSMASSG